MSDRRRQRRTTVEEIEDRLRARFQAIIEESPDFFFVLAPDGRITDRSPSVDAAAVGPPPERLDDLLDLLEGTPRDIARAVFADTAKATGTLRVPVTTTRGHRWVEVHLNELTGLPNRRALNIAGNATLERARVRRTNVALLLIDLDGFKGVNDTLGHAVGDLLLAQVASRLERATASYSPGSAATSSLSWPRTSTESRGALVLAERLIAALRTPIDVEDQQSQLQTLPVDCIKIDRWFIERLDLQTGTQGASVVQAIVDLGRGLDVVVVAEGVEEQAQLDVLLNQIGPPPDVHSTTSDSGMP